MYIFHLPIFLYKTQMCANFHHWHMDYHLQTMLETALDSHPNAHHQLHTI